MGMGGSLNEDGELPVCEVHEMRKKDTSEKELTETVEHMRRRMSELEALETDHRRIEDALQDSEVKYRNLIDQSQDAIYLIHDGKFEIVNRRFVELFGYTQEEVNAPEFDFMQLIAPKSWHIIEKRINEMEKVDSVSLQYELTALSRDGREIEVEASVSYIRYDSGFATQGILRDITERKRLQEQLLQSEKMSALGQLVSGVAHELNNPLTGVLGYAELLLTSSDLPKNANQNLMMIYDEAERARKIVENLLTFARQRKPEKKEIELNEIIERTLDIRAYAMRVNNIQVFKTLDQRIPLICADEYQIQQVFMNIIINAEQAILESHGEGQLEVETEWDTVKNRVRISFRDDGPGIIGENLSKIFDPFFTTKPDGKGTGLGLAISYGIVEEHEGRIIAENEEGGGARFVIELPMGEMDSTSNQAVQPAGKETEDMGEKRVLVVDDETLVVDLVKTALECEGYIVETASNGDSALRKIDTQAFDMVISDLKMPGKGGIDVFLYCMERKPYLAKRFLFLTGDIASSESRHFIEECNVPYLSKPFDLKALRILVEELCQGHEH